MRMSLGLIVGLVLLVGCNADTGGDREMPTRPVTVIELTERDYARERERTGVVSLYREEKISFEIGVVTLTGASHSSANWAPIADRDERPPIGF